MPRRRPTPDEQCTATSKRTGLRCTDWRMKGSNVCYHHGGASLKGAAHPRFKNGKDSKYLPARLIGMYEEALSDPDLLTLNRELALLKTRLNELKGKIDEGGGKDALQRIQKAYKDMRKAMAAGDKEETAATLYDLDDAINAAVQDYAVWNDIYETIGLIGRTSAAETKRMMDAEYVVKIDEVMTFVGALAGILRESITDRKQLNVIQGKVQKLLENNYGKTDDRA